MKKNTLLIIILIILLILLAVVITLLVIVNNDKKISDAKPQPTEKIYVYLFSDTSDKRIHEIENTIYNIDGVKSIEYSSKEEQLEKAKKRLKKNQKLLEGWEKDNPFNPLLIVTITSPELSDSVIEEINKITEVFNIDSIFQISRH